MRPQHLSEKFLGVESAKNQELYGSVLPNGGRAVVFLSVVLVKASKGQAKAAQRNGMGPPSVDAIANARLIEFSLLSDDKTEGPEVDLCLLRKVELGQ